MEMRSHQKLR
jgi:hypothetical protein